MDRIATDTFTFDKLRKGGYLYVDKTADMLPLVDGSVGSQFFCARPRRFGKSLAVTTLRAIFQGKKDLFTGLAIEDQWDWSRTWPVIRLDMGSTQAADSAEFRNNLEQQLKSNSADLGLPLDSSAMSPAAKFMALIRDAAASNAPSEANPLGDGTCVLLVDEYDKPLLGRLGQENVEEFRAELKAFYSVIKTMEEKLRFTFITGVSKFSKVLIFSDLNNLTDITMDPRFPRLFGYTHEEVLKYFGRGLPELAEKNGLPTPEAALEQLKRRYDGYCFGEGYPLVFNPVSVGKCFATCQYKDFWFETGTPTFLIDLMRRNPLNLDDLEIQEEEFAAYEPARPAFLPIMFQTGYLTIKSVRWEGDVKVYGLAFPNFEVKRAFSYAVSKSFTDLDEDDRPALLTQMVKALRAGDVNGMLDALSCFFANIPANITVKREKYYQSLFYAVFVLIGARIQAKGWTNRGRFDAVAETEAGIFFFEFKLNDTAEAALAQIKEKGYHEKYLRRGKPVTLVGVAFDAEMRNLSDRRIEGVVV